MIEKIILLNKKPNNNPILLISILIFIITIVITFKLDTYDSYKTIGILECQETCIIKTNIPYTKLNILDQNPRIKYNQKTYNINKIEYNDIYIEGDIPYQEISLQINLKKESKLLEFNIEYNKQRIYKKIINIIEGD